MHRDSCFVTLTYSPEKLPTLSSVVPEHARDFLKRLRARISPAKLRFFLCGEYGDQSERPHYHAILFGVGVSHATAISEAWGNGHVGVYECNHTTCQYTAGYVTKKMTSRDDPRLNGRHPEFARMSLKPGIGALAMAVLCDAFYTDAGVEEFRRVGDVPHRLRMGRQFIPLGRYLRRKLREEVGMPDGHVKGIVDAFLSEKSAEVRSLWLSSFDDPKIKSASVKGVLVKVSQGKVASIEARQAIYQRRGL